jgi:hypothetical protein
MPTFSALIFAAWACLLIYSFRQFDLVLSTEHRKTRRCWEDDGCPCGYFWRPKIEEPISTYPWTARNRLAFRWLFQTPAWARDDTEISGALRRYRFSVIILVLLLAVACILAQFTG